MYFPDHGTSRIHERSPVRTTRSFQLLQNAEAACLLKDLRQMDYINICVLRLALATRVFLDAVQRTDFDLWCCVHFKSETIYLKKSPTVGKMKQGHCWSCSHHNFKLVSLSFVSTNSLSLGKFSPTFPPLLTGRPHREEKELFYSMVCKHYRRKLNTLVYSILN